MLIVITDKNITGKTTASSIYTSTEYSSQWNHSRINEW